MKKILSIGLMLCIFTAMIVGTAAATPVKTTTTFASVDGCQQINAYGVCAKVDQCQTAGAITIGTVKAGCLKVCDVKAVGITQNQCGSVACGAVCAEQTAKVCVVTATCN